MESDNELIAEFMDGLKLKLTGPRNMWFIRSRNQTVDVEKMEYDTSWDWLMPVVEKIDKMTPELKIPEDLQALKENKHPIDIYMKVTALPIAMPISEVYKEVIDFIKWFNSQTPHP